MSDEDKAVIMVMGADRIGIVAGIAEALAEDNVNIVDLASTKMSDLFVMVLLADLSSAKEDISSLKSRLEARGRELGVQVVTYHYNIFKVMHKV
ncbi:MAG TPA: ACT domain-containing protein [Nitrososphaeria archaeon]|jgi:ACT domain-containing protein|nr:ACT domain-containing protein [Conexivisphaerales archaeon]HEU16395.1 ACT domain-containing protein [Nitrososphaeria archaeon]